MFSPSPQGEGTNSLPCLLKSMLRGKITKSQKNHVVEPSMFRRRNILEENVQIIISLEVEIHKSSTSRYLMHVTY